MLLIYFRAMTECHELRLGLDVTRENGPKKRGYPLKQMLAKIAFASEDTYKIKYISEKLPC